MSMQGRTDARVKPHRALGRGTVALAALALGSSLWIPGPASAEVLAGNGNAQALANISLSEIEQLDKYTPQEFTAMQKALPEGRAASGNVLMATQIGRYNRLESYSYSYQGEGNTTVALQKGRANRARLEQNGSGNLLELVQQGNGNRANLQQTGEDMYLGLIQQGNGNMFTYHQTASSPDAGWYKVYQRGGTEVTVTKTNIYMQ